MVPTRAQKRLWAFHEPSRPSNCSLAWESGAEDACTPNATAWSADSSASAKRLECVRFIGAFRPARDGQRFMVPMHGRNAEGAFHESAHPRPLPGGEQPSCRVLSVPLLGGLGVGSSSQCAPKMAWRLSMKWNAGLRHGLFSSPITHAAVPETGAPPGPGSGSQCTA